MHTGVNDSSDNTKWADFNLNYRKFQVTTGWRIPSTAAASPGLQDFAGVKVDFSAFERAAETYTGALYGLAMAGSAAAIGALAMSFWDGSLIDLPLNVFSFNNLNESFLGIYSFHHFISSTLTFPNLIYHNYIFKTKT